MRKQQIAIFASGSGTNMERLTSYFADSTLAEVAVVVCNNKGAGVIDRAKRLEVPLLMINRASFYNSTSLREELLQMKIDLIVLAGFLWLVPDYLIQAFPNKIINIHPALLPSYGGKGMYGMRVHEAVIEAGEKISGITIHHVNEHYDEGDIIFQKSIALMKNETPDSLAARIHQLEYEWFPKAVEQVLSSTHSLTGKIGR